MFRRAPRPVLNSVTSQAGFRLIYSNAAETKSGDLIKSLFLSEIGVWRNASSLICLLGIRSRTSGMFTASVFSYRKLKIISLRVSLFCVKFKKVLMINTG